MGPAIRTTRLGLRRFAVIAAVTLGFRLILPAEATDQPPRPPARPGYTVEEPEIVCPAELGVGVVTGRRFCDIMSGADPAQGVLIALPPHRGDVLLSFDLHNRHTYSEEQVKAGRAYARYTAVIGALTMDNTLISRAAVRSEFRREADLVDRVGGGAGPRGVKAVAPSGTAQVSMTIPAAETQVSLLGERLTVERADGSAVYTSPGRPIAVISNVTIEYRPGPVRRPGQ